MLKEKLPSGSFLYAVYFENYVLFLPGLDGVPDHVADEERAKGKQCDCQLGVVFFDNVFLAVGEVAEACQHAVPDGCTEEGVKRERNKLHVGDACGYRNQLANHRDEAAHEGGNCAMFAEVVFGFLHLAGVKQ